MTIDYQAALEGLGPILESLAGVSVGQRDESAPYAFPERTGAKAFAQLSYKFRSVKSNGFDELRATYDADVKPEGDLYPGALGSIVYEATGQRRVILELRVENTDMAVTAWPFAERLRNRLRLPSARAALRELGLAVATIGETRTMSVTNGGRAMSVCVLEVWCNASTVETEAVTTIETIEAEITEESEDE